MRESFPSKWILYPLEECIDVIIDYRGKTPKKTNYGIPLITAKIVKKGCIEEPNEFIAPEDYEIWMRRGIPKPGDVVITTEAPLGEVAQLDNRKVALAQRLITLRGKEGLMDNTFLKYVLQSSFVQNDIKAKATGTTVLGVKQSELRKVPLPVPPLPEQKAIASILGSLDDKIELNRKMNETLEAMARAIFKSWFADFDPIPRIGPHKEWQDSQLGKIPTGWGVQTMNDIAELYRDTITPGDFPDEVFEHYSIPAFDAWQMPVRDLGSNVKSNKFLLPENCVLISKLNPRIPRIWFPKINKYRRAVASTEFLVLVPKSPYTSEFIYSLCICTSFWDTFTSLVTGTSSSHQRVKPDDLLSLKIVCPANHVLIDFTQKVRPMFTNIQSNKEQSSTFASIRDALLLKLLSGELRVKDAERFMEKPYD